MDISKMDNSTDSNDVSNNSNVLCKIYTHSKLISVNCDKELLSLKTLFSHENEKGIVSYVNPIYLIINVKYINENIVSFNNKEVNIITKMQHKELIRYSKEHELLANNNIINEILLNDLVTNEVF
jgi:hypothetical protein